MPASSVLRVPRPVEVSWWIRARICGAWPRISCRSAAACGAARTTGPDDVSSRRSSSNQSRPPNRGTTGHRQRAIDRDAKHLPSRAATSLIGVINPNPPEIATQCGTPRRLRATRPVSIRAGTSECHMSPPPQSVDRTLLCDFRINERCGHHPCVSGAALPGPVRRRITKRAGSAIRRTGSTQTEDDPIGWTPGDRTPPSCPSTRSTCSGEAGRARLSA